MRVIVRNMTNEAVEPSWIPSDATFGARLALVRQHRGWTNVKEAALSCGLPVESWRGWEQGGHLGALGGVMRRSSPLYANGLELSVPPATVPSDLVY